MSNLIDNARAFAIGAHDAVGQRRKWDDEPYWKHPLRVADTVRDHGGTDEMIAAAYLHDVLEDTQVPLPTLVEEFGWLVAHLVWELTDPSKQYPDQKRKWRKTLDRLRIPYVSAEAQTIKLADLIDNTKSVTNGSLGFAKIYMEEKRQLLGAMTRGNDQLREIAWNQVEQYFNGK